MLEKKEDGRKIATILDIDTLVPQKHPLRAVEAAVDWSRVYALAAEGYSPNKGRPGVDPVVLVKLAFLKEFYGHPSMRRTLEEAEVNLAYRWFLGYNLLDKPPHPSTVAKNLRRRFDPSALAAFLEEVRAALPTKKHGLSK